MRLLRITGFATLLITVTVFSTTSSAADIHHAQFIVLDAAGKTESISVIRDSEPISIDVLNISIEEERLQKYQLRYRFFETISAPFLLSESDQLAEIRVQGSDAIFTIPPTNGRFVIYNLWMQTNTVKSKDELLELQKRKQALAKEIADLKKEIESTDDFLELTKKKAEYEKAKDKWDVEKKAINIELTNVDARIKTVEKDIEPYTHISVEAAVKEIRKVQDDRNALAKTQQELQAKIVSGDKALKDLDTARNELEAKIYKKLKEKSNEHQNLANDIANSSHPKYDVLKLGAILSGKTQKAVYYDVLAEEASVGFSLKQMGDYPVLTQDDFIYAVVVNRIVGQLDKPLILAIQVEAGKPINPAPVRPSFSEAVPQAGFDDKVFPAGTKKAYADTILAFAKKFQGNDILTVSIQTHQIKKKKDQEDEIETVKLLDQAKYPQIHPLYRYNLALGIVASFLRDSEFVKVQTQLDDASTPEQEARFRIQENQDDRQIEAVTTFSIYIKKLDTLEPLTFKEAIIPNPMIGFGLSDPTKNFFFGASHELVRSTQLVYGVHVGKIHELKTRKDVGEDMDPSAPPTVERFDKKFFFGLTFNLNFVKNIFSPKG